MRIDFLAESKNGVMKGREGVLEEMESLLVAAVTDTRGSNDAFILPPSPCYNSPSYLPIARPSSLRPLFHRAYLLPSRPLALSPFHSPVHSLLTSHSLQYEVPLLSQAKANSAS